MNKSPTPNKVPVGIYVVQTQKSECYFRGSECLGVSRQAAPNPRHQKLLDNRRRRMSFRSLLLIFANSSHQRLFT